MTMRAWELIRDNAGAAVSVLGLVGFGSAAAALGDASAMISEHPGASTLLAAASFCAGSALAGFLRTHGRRARASRLERCFVAMSPRRKEMVAAALDLGEAWASAADMDALALCKLGILIAPECADGSRDNCYSVAPDVVLEIREHRAEWLGM